MERTAYILTFDRDDEVDYRKFHEQLTSLPSVITWWHYIKSSYILISRTGNATELNKQIIELVPEGKIMLLIEINLKNRNGLLVKAAWEWLRKQDLKMNPPSTT